MAPETHLITKKGIEEIVQDADSATKILVGMSNNRSRKERLMIADALTDNGLDVYTTSTLWPNDSYIEHNGLVIPSRDFGKLGHGGNYVFGEDFVLVSEDIQKGLEKHMERSEFEKFFEGLEVYFVKPYSRIILHPTDFQIGEEIKKIRKNRKYKHIDLTIGYIPGKKLLTVADVHFMQTAMVLRDVVGGHGLRILTTSQDKMGEYHPFVNNYLVAGKVFTNSYAGFPNDLKRGGVVGVGVGNIEELTYHGGSIKCVTNKFRNFDLLDKLGIDYMRNERSR